MKIDRKKVLNKFDSHCAYCGMEITLKEMQIDHVIPKANFEMCIANNFKVPYFLKHLRLGHENHIDNLFPSCRKCNHYKSTMSIEVFRSELGKQIERLQENTNYKLAKKYGQLIETESEICFYFEKFKIFYKC